MHISRVLKYMAIAIMFGATLNHCFAQETMKDDVFLKEWNCCGNFVIDNVYQIEMATIYTVSCVDTIDLHYQYDQDTFLPPPLT